MLDIIEFFNTNKNGIIRFFTISDVKPGQKNLQA